MTFLFYTLLIAGIFLYGGPIVLAMIAGDPTPFKTVNTVVTPYGKMVADLTSKAFAKLTAQVESKTAKASEAAAAAEPEANSVADAPIDAPPQLRKVSDRTK